VVSLLQAEAQQVVLQLATKNNMTSMVIQQNNRKAPDDGHINVRSMLST